MKNERDEHSRLPEQDMRSAQDGRGGHSGAPEQNGHGGQDGLPGQNAQDKQDTAKGSNGPARAAQAAPAQAAPPPAPKPAARKPAAQAAPRPDAGQPVRRVGSTTLGVTLIALGVFFLLYYFVPGFNWLLVAKLSPVLLIVLGVEVLVCSFRQERSKYDFLAIFSCLLVMCACFCVALAPIVWEYAGPKSEAARRTLTAEYENGLYDALRQEADGPLELDDLHVWLDLPFGSSVPESPEELGLEAKLDVTVGLSGPYDSREDFAAACRRVLDVVQAQKIQPDQVYIAYHDADGWSYTLELNSRVQLDWTTARIEQAVEDNRAQREQEMREEQERLAAEQEAEREVLEAEREALEERPGD